MLFTLQELIDLIIMTLGVAYIFMDRFGVQQTIKSNVDPVIAQYQGKLSRFNLQNLWIAALITAPAVIFHELAHKLVAISYGLQATFHAAYFWLSFGVIMKLLNTGLIFFVPGYVSHSAAATPIQSAAIAFAGPFLNFILWLGCWILIKFKPVKMSVRTIQIVAATKYINGFLFIFNMIPIGFFDGSHVMEGLMKYFAG
jgi:Zn-dependent protease